MVHGRVDRQGHGKFGQETHLGVVSDGGYFGADALTADDTSWDYSAIAATDCTLLVLTREQFGGIEIASGHSGEPTLPATFADYELAPRGYELSVT